MSEASIEGRPPPNGDHTVDTSGADLASAGVQLCDPLVSLQVATANDAIEGHRASGLLLARQIVAFPGPHPWLGDSRTRLEVLLATPTPEDGAIVERIRPDRIDLVGFTDHAELAVAVVHLSRPSPFPPIPRVADREDLHDALLGGDPDVWTALETARAVSHRIRKLPPPEVLLRPVVEAEEAHRNGLIQPSLDQDPGIVEINWCKIFGCARLCRWD